MPDEVERQDLQTATRILDYRAARRAVELHQLGPDGIEQLQESGGLRHMLHIVLYGEETALKMREHDGDGAEMEA